MAFCKKSALSEIQNKETLYGQPIHRPADSASAEDLAKAEEVLRVESEKSNVKVPESCMPKLSKGPFEAVHEHPDLEDQPGYTTYKMTIPYDENVDKVSLYVLHGVEI